MADREPGTRIAGYRIEGILGRGAAGVVYRAADHRLGRDVALKVIDEPQASEETFRQRLVSETRAMAAIDHPNVLPVYEVGASDDVVFVTSRLVEGSDLGELLDAEGAMAPERALHFIAQLGAALDAVHERGLVHGDVNLAKALVASQDRRGQASEQCYLIPLGPAKWPPAEEPWPGPRPARNLGTFDYTAPEQIAARPVGERADQYALGAILFRCLTGSAPFALEGMRVMWAHIHDPPPAVSEHVPGAPAALDSVIARAMAKEPADRFETCGELVHAAQGALPASPAG